jgi:uncharacterized NAD-dependent epimerase/dehydratase family protein
MKRRGWEGGKRATQYISSLLREDNGMAVKRLTMLAASGVKSNACQPCPMRHM